MLEEREEGWDRVARRLVSYKGEQKAAETEGRRMEGGRARRGKQGFHYDSGENPLEANIIISLEKGGARVAALYKFARPLK